MRLASRCVPSLCKGTRILSKAASIASVFSGSTSEVTCFEAVDCSLLERVQQERVFFCGRPAASGGCLERFRVLDLARPGYFMLTGLSADLDDLWPSADCPLAFKGARSRLLLFFDAAVRSWRSVRLSFSHKSYSRSQ